jgi:cytochrome b
LLHVTLGYTLAGLLAFRLLYGLIGPRQVRLKALWGKVANAPHWARSVRAFVTRTPGAPKATPLLRQTENLAMGVATVALLLAVVPLTLSGYATYNDWGGEWLEDLHEATGEFMLLLVLAHLGLLLLVSGLRRKNQALPMLTGRVEGAGPDLVKRDRTWLAALLLAAVLGYWAWEWQQAPQTPASNAAAHRADHRDHDD